MALEQQESYILFSSSIRSNETRKAYTLLLKKFMEYLGEDDIKMLWDTAKYSIEKRRASGTGALSYMQNLKQLNSKAENCARKHFQNGL